MPAYFMCWPISGCNVLGCRLLRQRIRCDRSLFCTQLCRWSWWTHLPSMLPQLFYLGGLKPYYCNKFSFETFDVISVWLHSVINPSSTVCVSITDPGMTLKHRDLTVWGWVATTMDIYKGIIIYRETSMKNSTLFPWAWTQVLKVDPHFFNA